MLINADAKRKHDLEDARLYPYDGTTVYQTTETDSKIEKFMGYELKPYRIKRRDGITEIGTTICHQYRVSYKPTEPKVEKMVDAPRFIIHVDDSYLDREYKENIDRVEAEIWAGQTKRAKEWWGRR